MTELTSAERSGVHESDAAIIAAVLAGNDAAYARLFARYRDRYTRFAVRMVGSPEDADEALQSAFLRAYRSLAQCSNPDRFGAWLYQIVANECRTHSSRRGRRERRFVRDEDAIARALEEHPADRRALRDEIERALARLDVDQREAFILKHVEDLSYEEMAEITGAGISALKMRVKRACDRLRELLEGVHA